MKVFVAGATGETGRRIVSELVKRDISVRAMVRNLQTAQEILPPQAELVVGNVLEPESLVNAIADSTVLICATGARPSFDLTGPYKVDYEGTKNLVEVANAKGIEQFVLVSSLCTSQFLHPLNLFWLVLFWKKQAEEHLKKSGLTYTIVRPGGLKNTDEPLSIVMGAADSLSEGSISRTKVAEICVEALFQPSARNKTVEIIAGVDVRSQSFAELFASVL